MVKILFLQQCYKLSDTKLERGQGQDIVNEVSWISREASGEGHNMIHNQLLYLEHFAFLRNEISQTAKWVTDYETGHRILIAISIND